VQLALELAAKDAEVIWMDGRVAFESGRQRQAVERYREALSIDRGFVRARASLGTALSAQGRRQEALEELGDEACEASQVSDLEGQVGLFLARANVYQKLGRVDDAEICYRQAQVLDPADPTLHWGLGNVHYSREEFEDAVEEYAKAIEKDPKNPVLLASLASTLFLIDDLGKAEQVILRAIELDRSAVESPDNLRLLALILDAQGRHAEAQQSRQRAERVEDARTRILNALQPEPQPPAAGPR